MWLTASDDSFGKSIITTTRASDLHPLSDDNGEKRARPNNEEPANVPV